MGRGHQKDGVDVPSLVSQAKPYAFRTSTLTHLVGNGQVV
jgi:hypothetical protein